MRHLGYAIVVVVCSLAVAFAQPKKGGKAAPKAAAPTAPAKKGPPQWQPLDPKVQAEVDKIDKDYYAAIAKQHYIPAAKAAKKAYEIVLKAAGPDSLQTERRQQTYASALQMAGDYNAAEKIFHEMLARAEKNYGPESREASQLLSQINGVLMSQFRWDDSEKIYQRLLAISKKLDGEKSQAYAQQLSSHASLFTMRNEYTQAMKVYEQSLAIFESLAPSKDDGSLIGPLQSLGYAYWSANQQQKAIATFDRLIAISQTGKNVYPTYKTMTPWMVATHYHYGGRKDLSAPLFKKAIAMMETEIQTLEKTKPNDPMLPSSYSQLANMLRMSGDIGRAEKVLEDLIAKNKGKQYTGYETQLADIKRMQGKDKEALALIEAGTAQLVALAPSAAPTMNYLRADIQKDLGNYKEAEKLLADYLTYIGKMWGKTHPSYGQMQFVAVSIYAPAGKLKQAENALDIALDSAERDLTKVLKSGTEADHAIYFSKNSHILDSALAFHMNIAPTSATAAKLALTTLLRRKGRLLDAAAATIATLRTRLSAADQKLLDELNSARAQLAKLTVAGPSSMPDAEEFTKAVAALEDKIQRLEMQISKKSAAYRTVTQAIELPQIQKLIPADAKLVEIVNYQPYDYKMSYADRINGKFAPRRYAAYIVGAKGDPVVVDLAEATKIDKAVEQFRKALADPDNDAVNDLGRALYDLTMAKIIPKLDKSSNILVAPDGSLNVVPFSALVDSKGEFLLKKYTFTYLTSGRDLLRVTVKTKAKGGGVMFADPKFDSTSGGAPAGGKTRGTRSVDLASLSWPPLPGTAAEADAVTKTMKGLKLYRGEQATEGTLKSIKAPKILHLATHGFFLPDEEPTVGEGDRGAQAGTPMGPMGPAAGAPPTMVENPLLRSGLALAGANKLASGDEDGVLTALEATGLDLNGTKMVVLSACETGVGKVSNGDGVYGLRRSLVIAGAESLVMSMWQVDDFATKELMVGLYKRLAAGKPRSAALREIQLELSSKQKYAHPFYWAAFVPAGATTPLKD